MDNNNLRFLLEPNPTGAGNAHRRRDLLVVQEGKKKDTKEETEKKPEEDQQLEVHGSPRIASNKYANRLQRMARTLLHDFEIIQKSYRNDIVGQPVFDKKLTEDIKAGVMRAPKVKAAMDDYRASHPTTPPIEIRKIVNKILDRMMASFHEVSLRYFAYIVQNVLHQLYNGIHISQKELNRLKEVARKAQADGVPLVLIPTHKSHIDYLVVSYVFFLCNLSMPFIAAGDNLMMPIVGELLRHSGAFFIRRRFAGDKLYKAVFDEYITQILERGYNLEFFIEGGRSRTGKLMQPRLGMIGVVLDAVLEGRAKDAIIVPISIGYDKVIETPSYVKELLGANKEKESLGQLLRSSSILKLNFGRIDVRLAKPFSVKEYINEEISLRKLNPTTDHDRKILTQVLAFSILYRINKIIVAMPTALVVTVLLTHRGRGLARKDLIAKFDWLRAEIIKRGGKVASPDVAKGEENTGKLVDSAIGVLGNLVGKQKNVLEPVYTPNHRFELSYYRNQIIHLFVNEGMVACGIYAHTKHNPETLINKKDLLGDISFLSQLLKLEIIYLPSPSIKSTFEQTLKEMQDRGMIKVENEQVQLLKAGHDLFDFICALFWPFIDSIWLLVTSFYALYPQNLVEEKAFLNRVQMLGFTLYYKGELTYYESVSKETLSNGVQLFLSMNVIEKHTVDDKGMTVVKLGKEYALDEAKLVALIERVGHYRREGKYSSNDYHLSPRIKDTVKLTIPRARA